MSAQAKDSDVRPSSDIEFQCRARLLAHLKGQRFDVEKNVDELMNCDGGFVDRFQFLARHLEPRHLERALVSGCAVGTEMLVARRFGFRQVAGTEVDPTYVEIARERLGSLSGFEVAFYDGRRLPWGDGTFTAVISGHIIEHTPSPELYLREHLRVLAPGGIVFLEFPDRYHWRELHTGVPSVEYLPRPLRNLALRLLSSGLMPPRSRAAYESIRTTLQPVSVPQVRAWLRAEHRNRSQLVAVQRPAPGYTRVIIQRA